MRMQEAAVSAAVSPRTVVHVSAEAGPCTAVSCRGCQACQVSGAKHAIDDPQPVYGPLQCESELKNTGSQNRCSTLLPSQVVDFLTQYTLVWPQ